MKKFLFFICFLSLSIGVQGESLIIRPSADKQFNDWDPVNCTDHYDCVNEPVTDDSDHLKECANYQADAWDMEDVSGSIPGGATIDSVVMFSRIKNDLFQNFHCELKIGIDISAGASHDEQSWTNHTENMSAPGARSWSRENLDSLIMQAQTEEDHCPSYYCYISQAYCTVWYTTEAPEGRNTLLLKRHQRK